MKHVFVFDPKSFYGQQWKMDGILDSIGQFFRTQEKPDWSIHISRYRRDAIVILQEETAKAKPGDTVRVYAIGGEEILFDCINAVAHFPNMQIAIVPYGSANNFLNIFGEHKLEEFRDIPALVKADALPTDIIRWGVNYALNSCYIGLNSALAARVHELKASMGKGSYLFFSKISNFFNYIATSFDKEIADQEYQITIDDQNFAGKYSLIHIANGPYHDGKLTGLSGASPNDGVLDITLIKSGGPLIPLSTMRRYAKGKRPRSCLFLQGKKITIKSGRQMWIQMDNEYFRDTGIEISVVHNAAQVVTVNGATYPVAEISGT